MPNLNNPAGRLYYWLDKAQDVANGAKPRDVLAMNAWCEVFGLNAGSRADKGECLRLGSDLVRESVAVRQAVDDLPPGFPRSALNGFEEVEQCLDYFSHLTSQYIESMMTQVKATGWQSLRMLDEMLGHIGGEALDLSVLDGYVETVGTLIEEVSADDSLPPTVRQFMLKMLRELRDGLLSAYVTGPEGLVRASDRWTASMVREPHLWDQVAATKWGPRLVTIYRDVMLTIATLAAVIAILPGASGDEIRQIENQHTSVIIDQSTDTAIHCDVTIEQSDEDVVDPEVVEDAEDSPSN